MPLPSLCRLGLSAVALTGVSPPALGEEPVLYGGFITARKATDRQVRFWKKLTAEGIPLVATRVRDSAYQRIRGHAVIVKQCESVEADLCLIIEDFVDWRSGSLARSIQEVVNTVPDFDVAILGRNDQEFRCADLEPALGSFAPVRCSPIANYAYVVHRRYFQAMFEALNSPGEICGYHTDIYFGTEQMYAVDPSSRWYVKSPLPVRVRWQRAPSPGDFASRCALGALSSRPVVLLHPKRAGGTSLCDLAAQWIDVGRRGGVDNCRIDSLQAFRDAAGAWPFAPNHELDSGQVRRLFARGLGFISVEPSFSDWDDGSGHEDGSDTNRSARMARWLGSMTGLRSGFWSSYLHVLMVRNPLDRYLSWLQFCIPACDLMEKVDMDQAESHRDFVARCFKEKVSEFVELVLEPGLTRSSFSIRSPFLFQDDRRQFVPGCRRATLGYHVAQASNCLGRHLVAGIGRADDSAKLEEALSVLHRFDVVVDVSLAPNESGVLLQDAFRRNIACGERCADLAALPDLRVPRSRPGLERMQRIDRPSSYLTPSARRLFEERNQIDRLALAASAANAKINGPNRWWPLRRA